jgi:hypothetical protein
MFFIPFLIVPLAQLFLFFEDIEELEFFFLFFGFYKLNEYFGQYWEIHEEMLDLDIAETDDIDSQTYITTDPDIRSKIYSPWYRETFILPTTSSDSFESLDISTLSYSNHG